MSQNDYIHPIELNENIIPCNLFLAPLAGFTDYAFRAVCIEKGACFTYTEMVSAEGLIRNSRKTINLLERAPGEEQYGIQLFAATPQTAEEAARRCRSFSPTLIDFNCGCPVPKVIKNNAGAALLKDPDRINAVVKALCKGAGTIPVSVKIRSGWNNNSINYLETASAAVEGGAALICLHPRTRNQGYSGKAAWHHIAKLKENSPVPIIGSGDLFSPRDALAMFRETGCDGLMFARGAIGNPFVFQTVRDYLASNRDASDKPPFRTVSIREKLDTAWHHYTLLLDKFSEERANKEMKKHFAAYTKGLPHSAEFRNQLMHADKKEIFEKIFHKYMEENIKIM